MHAQPGSFLRIRDQGGTRLRLFCLPYAGGSSAIYTPWAPLLPSELAIHPVELPGRGTRMNEAPLSQLADLIPPLAAAIAAHRDKPFALFGHSMGAVIAFELARHLIQYHGCAPVHLILSGRGAPGTQPRRQPLHLLPDADLLRELQDLKGTPPEILEHRELMALILPMLRADFAVVETYQPEPGEPFDLPVAVYGGLQDERVSRSSLQAWAPYTRGAFAVRMFPGAHFFLNSHRTLVAQTLVRELAPYL